MTLPALPEESFHRVLCVVPPRATICPAQEERVDSTLPGGCLTAAGRSRRRSRPANRSASSASFSRARAPSFAVDAAPPGDSTSARTVIALTTGWPGHNFDRLSTSPVGDRCQVLFFTTPALGTSSLSSSAYASARSRIPAGLLPTVGADLMIDFRTASRACSLRL